MAARSSIDTLWTGAGDRLRPNLSALVLLLDQDGRFPKTMADSLSGDTSRQATDSIRGYVYQIWQSLLTWIDLKEDQILYLEGAEDFDVTEERQSTATQVRDKAGELSLGRAEAHKALEDFLDIQEKNSDRKVLYRYLTAAQAGAERGSPFGKDRKGLEVWSRCQRTGEGVDEIRDFLLARETLPSKLKDFLTEKSEEEILDLMIRRFRWETSAAAIHQIETRILEKLVYRGELQGISPNESCKAVNRLLREVADKVTSSDARKLTLADYYRVFEEATTIRVPASPSNLQRIVDGYGTALPSDDASSFCLVAGHLRVDLRNRMDDARQSELRFNQTIHDHAKFVDRESSRLALEDWYEAGRERKALFVLSGDEGVGKTWAAISWLAGKSDSEELCPIVLTAPDVYDTNKLADGIASYIARSLGESGGEGWVQQARRWLSDPSLRNRFLLLFDGIDERGNVEWDSFFREAATADVAFSNALSQAEECLLAPIPTVATCRSQFWQEYLAHTKDVRLFALKRFSAPELTSYLRRLGREPTEFQDEVREMMRTPRTCGWVIDRYDRLSESGEITLDRLLLEDARYHAERYRKCDFSYAEFVSLLQRLGSGVIEGKSEYWTSELRELVVNDEILNDLKTRGVFRPRGQGRYELESSRLCLGLGLLIVDNLMLSDITTLSGYRNEIDRYLESAPGLDQHAPILAAGVLGAITQPSRDSALLTAILEKFSTLRNVQKGPRERVNSYYPEIHAKFRILPNAPCRTAALASGGSGSNRCM